MANAAAGDSCTRCAVGALRATESAAARRPPFRVTPAHVLVGLIRERESAAGELLLASGITEDRIWAAMDYRRAGYRGLRRLRDPMFGLSPRWTHAARDILQRARVASRDRSSTVVDTLDLLQGVIHAEDALTTRMLDGTQLMSPHEAAAVLDAHRLERERSATAALPDFGVLRRIRVSSS